MSLLIVWKSHDAKFDHQKPSYRKAVRHDLNISCRDAGRLITQEIASLLV